MLGLLLLVAAAAALTRAQEYRCILTEQYDPSTGLCVDVQSESEQACSRADAECKELQAPRLPVAASTTSAQIGSSYASRAKCTYGQCEARTFDESEDQCATPADCPDDGRTSEWLCNDGECRPYSCVFPYVAAYGQCMLWEPTPAPSADYCLVGEVYVDGTCVDLQSTSSRPLVRVWALTVCTTDDPQNCGELEFSCYSSDAINSRCLAGRCFGECPYTGLNRRYYRDRRCWSATEMNGPQCAWTQEWDGETCVNVATDHENCGSIGAYCPYSSELENGYSDCVAGVCEFTCVDGYRPVANECVENYPVLVAAASQRARARRRSLSLQTACPRCVCLSSSRPRRD